MQSVNVYDQKRILHFIIALIRPEKNAKITIAVKKNARLRFSDKSIHFFWWGEGWSGPHEPHSDTALVMSDDKTFSRIFHETLLSDVHNVRFIILSNAVVYHNCLHIAPSLKFHYNFSIL